MYIFYIYILINTNTNFFNNIHILMNLCTKIKIKV